jgi:hypothetical protein
MSDLAKPILTTFAVVCLGGSALTWVALSKLRGAEDKLRRSQDQLERWRRHLYVTSNQTVRERVRVLALGKLHQLLSARGVFKLVSTLVMLRYGKLSKLVALKSLFS